MSSITAVIGNSYSRTTGQSVRCISESSTLSTQDIHKNKDLGLSLYPNPTNTDFSIKYPSNSKKDLDKVRVDVYNLAITLLLQQKGKEKISVNSLANGVYLVKIITPEGKIQAEKLIVEK